jgi:hypothetical protein
VLPVGDTALRNPGLPLGVGAMVIRRCRCHGRIVP